jgi:hypothetical protein
MKARKTRKMTQKEVKKMKMRMASKKKWLKCTKCDNEVLVDEDVIAVKCWECTSQLAPVPKRLLESKKKSDKPAGWRFMAEFVDKDGNVYHFGEEQPELKGTLEPSNVEKIRAEQKKKREETKKKKELRAKNREARLVKQYEKKKKALKKAEEKKQREIDKKNGKDTKKKSKKRGRKPVKKSAKKKNTNSKVRYEKFEENRIATDREQIQSLIESESLFAEHLRRRDINTGNIVKIARTSYAAIDRQTGVVKNKRRGYKVSLETGDTKIININVK